MRDDLARDRAIAAGVPAELRLVFACAAGPAGDAQVAALVASPLDWRTVAIAADRERAAPELLAALQRAAPAIAASPQAEPLRRLARVAAFECARLEAKLLVLLDAFGAAGIDVVLLKGAALALQQRGTLAGRPSRDLDLLLPPAALPAALRLALGCGWTSSRHAAADAFYEIAAHAAPLEDEAGSQLGLELHSDLFYSGHPFGLTGEAVRARAAVCAWRGRTFLVPSAQDQVVHLALHAAWSHALRGAWWRTWYDLAGILPADEAGWRSLLDAAEAARATTSLYWTLRLGRAFGALEVPASVLDALARPVPALLRRPLLAHVATASSALFAQVPSVRLDQLAWRLALQPRRSGHGAHVPWAHEELLGNSGPAPSPAMKLQQHLGRWRAYAAYARQILTA